MSSLTPLRLATLVAGLVVGSGAPARAALPPGAAGATLGIGWMDSASGGARNASWAPGVRADLRLMQAGPVTLRGELATVHLSAHGATEAVEVDTGYHAVMFMGSAGLRAGTLEPYLAAGPVAWWVSTRVAVDDADESYSDLAGGVAALVGVRAAEGPIVPRVEGGVVSRPGRTVWTAGVGVAWAWGEP